MKTLTLIDDHDLCIRTFLKEIDEQRMLGDKRAVLHVGAHMGEEVPAYQDHGYAPIYLVEANPEVLPGLEAKFAGAGNIHIVATAVGDTVGETEFVVHKTKKGGMESSGLLNLEKLGEIVPVFDSEVRHRVPMITIDELVRKLDLAPRVGLLVLDIQGAEMMALSGASDFLQQVDAVICEVNLIRNYEGCALEEDIDRVFASAGFTKQLAIYHELYDQTGRFPAWGECLWHKQR
ncbi:FkbM family methyltransferase [Cupriavidus sp. DL-D2]|uniref:FkbM family methyltransferase n=1 Tax=Cupriavidus sp. DL-D2 TaxID=3144974 RepID=UPI003214E327